MQISQQNIFLFRDNDLIGRHVRRRDIHRGAFRRCPDATFRVIQREVATIVRWQFFQKFSHGHGSLLDLSDKRNGAQMNGLEEETGDAMF